MRVFVFICMYWARMQGRVYVCVTNITGVVGRTILSEADGLCCAAADGAQLARPPSAGRREGQRRRGHDGLAATRRPRATATRDPANKPSCHSIKVCKQK